MICLDQVSKYYKRGLEKVVALDAVSLEIERGTLALLRGPSGSGKTTLINLCAGLALPDSGEIQVDGNPVHAMNRRSRCTLRAQRVAVVFQLFHLTPYLSAFENILLPTLATKVPDAAARAQHLMDELGIAHRADHRPGEMSAGERQRCALARALLAEPEVILADEPTGNLDNESAAVVLSALENRRRAGATILLVSHQPVDHVRPDVVFTLDNGKCVAMP